MVRSVRLQGHNYKIKHLHPSKMPDLLAEIDQNEGVIHVRKGLPPSRKVECILHEALHVILGQLHVAKEERVCESIGEYLTQFIRDNPSFIRHALKTLSR